MTIDTRPSPPVPPEADLKDFAFTPIYRARLFGSEFHAHASDAEWRAGMTLWLRSQDQVPAGSLPDDDIDLCRLAGLGCDMKTWKKLRPMALHGWFKCSDGRLYNRVVAEVVNRSWSRHHRLRHAALRKRRPKRIKGSRWGVIRRRILMRDGHRCQQCGATAPLEIDHIRPLAEGGDHCDDNLRVLCRPCNRRKSYKMVTA